MTKRRMGPCPRRGLGHGQEEDKSMKSCLDFSGDIKRPLLLISCFGWEPELCGLNPSHVMWVDIDPNHIVLA